MPRLAATALLFMFAASVAAHASMSLYLPHIAWPADAPAVTRSAGK